jgi:hypothetical protein
MPKLTGLLVGFCAIMAVIALRPGGERAAVALLQTETPTSTNTAEAPTSTPTSTVPTSTPTATPTATSTPGPSTAPILNFPTSQCLGSFPFASSANVTFTWTGPTNVSAIFLDLSIFDNTFADGTYITMVLAPGTTTFTWNGIQPGVAHFWRVTGQGLNGDWVMSAFGRFTPCGTQRLLSINYSCTGAGRARVEFRWAPSSSAADFQFLDISLFNNGFAPGTFLGAGPIIPNAQGLFWDGILANAAHYFRVNAFTIFGWGPSQTGSFVAVCP